MKTQTAPATRRKTVEPMHQTDDAPDNLPLNHVLHGDCRELLAKLPANSVDLVFADPPYNLQLKGDLWRPDLSHVDAVNDEWDKFSSFAEYDKFTRQWLFNCRRVLKDNGTLWVIGSYHNIYRVGAILQDLGYWVLNDVVWCKCLASTMKVYAKTQKGERPTTIKDLVRLDPKSVKLWNGTKWTQVLGWNESRSNEGLTLELRSGERIACTKEHRWATQRGLLAASDLQIGDVLDTCRLPEPEHTARPEALDDEIVGWFVGLYLAEGTRFNGTIELAGHTKEVERYARLCKLAEMYHGQCALHVHGENKCSIHLHGPMINALLDMYLQGNTERGKHLNPRCWERSNCFLKSILDGYLSGDGHYDAENDRWRLGLTQNYLWRDDLRTICARLEVSLRIRDGRVPYKGNPDHSVLKGEIRFQRRADTRSSSDTEIIAIKPAWSEQFWDIAVEDEPHLFALASGVLTHNSNPMPNFKGTRFCNAHETLLWAAKSEKQTKYTFNYKGMKAGNDDLQVRSDWHLPICTGDERLKENGEKAHATQKPEALIHRVLRACSNPGDVVLDPFFGTGTTGAVAKKLRRNFIGMEKEAKYVDLARARINAVVPPLVPDEMMPPPLDTPKARIPFVMLIEYGLLQTGDTLQLGRKGVMAYVLEDGTIVCNQHRGSIHKVGSLCLNKPSCNGWEHWFYIDKQTKKLRPIDDLREQLRKMTGK